MSNPADASLRAFLQLNRTALLECAGVLGWADPGDAFLDQHAEELLLNVRAALRSPWLVDAVLAGAPPQELERIMPAVRRLLSGAREADRVPFI